MVFSTLPVPALVGEGAAAAYEERLGQTSKEAATPSASVSHCAALAASGGCSWLHNVDECRKIVKHLSNQARPLSQEEVQQLSDILRTHDEVCMEFAIPERPTPPLNIENVPIAARIKTIQAFINKLEYNHTNQNYFNLCKARPYSRVMDTAKSILRDCLPIKCLEAVFLGMYLTNKMEDIERIPVSFKSKFGGKVYRHIILAVHHIPSDKYGAIGLSRKADLMYKDLKYDSMADLLVEYRTAYERLWQQVLKVWVGLPAPSDEFSYSPICWRYFCFKGNKSAWAEMTKNLEVDISNSKRLFSKWLQKPEIHHQEAASPEQPAASETSNEGAG